MMLRIQHERMQGHFIPSVREYFTLFGLTPERRRAARTPDVIVMHPGPMNRGVEIDSEVADGPYSVILEQVARTASPCGWRCCICWPADGKDARTSRSGRVGEVRLMNLLLKDGRVIDPANGRDGDVRRAHRGRADRARRHGTCRPTGAEVVRGAARLGRDARASSTSTCTCASPGRSTRRRSRPARRRPWPAGSPRSPACPTPTRSTTTPASRSSS